VTPLRSSRHGARSGRARNSYSPSRDGRRFLVNVFPEVEVSRTALVLNWNALLPD